MKRLLNYFIVPVFLIPGLSKSQDSAFTLKGKLLQPSSIKSLIFFYPTMHMDSILIQADGSFSYSGDFTEAGEMQITTRKSSITIWLDTGLTNLFLSEKPGRNGKVRLTIDSVTGSEDTYLYNYSLLPKEEILFESKPSQSRGFYSEKEVQAYLDSLKKATKPFWDSLRTARAFRKIDSVFKVRSDSKVLPWLIQYYEPTLGMNFMQKFYYRLSNEQQQSAEGKDLLNALNRLQLLKPGNFIEDFTIKDDHGKKFHFSSLESKYILIEFWASWCGPCRANNPHLREMYLKNKQAGLEIIGVSLDDDKKKWLQAIKQDKLTWINVSDLQGHNNAIAVKYKIAGIPFSVLLDENRKVVMVNPSTYVITEFFKNL